MLFSSSIFIFLFLPLGLLGYQVASRFGRTAMLCWLTLISLFFYGFWNPPFLILLGGSILMNYLFSYKINDGQPEQTRSRWLIVAICANLSALIYYKYFFPLLNFFHTYGLSSHSFNNVTLPLGISFFTFTQIAYLIDLRQQIAKQQGIVPYSVFVTFFPHLIAGPIIHPRELMPQLEEGRIRGLQLADVSLGLSWFVMGLGKKVIIADRIAPLADMLYAHPHSAGLATSWIGALAYSLQLYFDFSGYSDMALGLARIFSLEFPINFNSPFKSQSIIDFWQRWHMTLSRYLNEYLFTPITRWISGRRQEAGKKVSRKATATLDGFRDMVAFPLLSTMFIAGIWHGAGLQFIAFGIWHGCLLTINHGWRIFTPRDTRLHKVLPVPLAILITFICVVIGQVFFRAASLGDSFYILGTMAGLHGLGTSFAAFPFLAQIPSISHALASERNAILAVALCLFIALAMPNTQEILGEKPRDEAAAPSLLGGLRWAPTFTWSLALTLLFCVSVLVLDASTSFLYFQF